MDNDELARRRIEYETVGFDVSDAHPDPVRQFELWFDDVADQLPQPHAVVLATADADGAPSCRTVLLRGIDARGLVFFTNYDSAKGRDLAANPSAELLFVWLDVHRQVRVRGRVEPTSAAESDEYFSTRPRNSQLAAVASPQSEVLDDRASLERLVAEAAERHEGHEVPRPARWGGYRVVPDRWEFWQGRPGRLHDRIRYRLDDSGSPDGAGWRLERLAP